ncbi:MAG: hypothetical protein ILO53_02245 [Clostridia bacterium]|nr:hypothetical protein [Clostridia bacterium]
MKNSRQVLFSLFLKNFSQFFQDVFGRRFRAGIGAAFRQASALLSGGCRMAFRAAKVKLQQTGASREAARQITVQSKDSLSAGQRTAFRRLFTQIIHTKSQKNRHRSVYPQPRLIGRRIQPEQYR